MKSAAGPRTRGVAALIALVACVLGTTATQRMRQPERPATKEPPTLTMHTERLGPDGTSCDGIAHVTEGRVPQGAREIVRLRVLADRPVPTTFFKQALAERAKKHCGSDATLQSAVASDDPRRMIEVSATVWERQAPPTSRRAKVAPPDPSAVDAGPSSTSSSPLSTGPAPFD